MYVPSLSAEPCSRLTFVQTFYPVLGFCYFAASSWTWNTVQAANRTHGRAAIDSLPPNRTEAWYTRKALCAHAYQIYLPVYFFLLSSLLSALKVWAPPIPGLATTLSAFNFSLACFVDGFYCFELAWRARGWGLERRAAAAEQRWSYLVAFGVPSTLISYFHPSGLLNMMLFMLSTYTLNSMCRKSDQADSLSFLCPPSTGSRSEATSIRPTGHAGTRHVPHCCCPSSTDSVGAWIRW